MTTIVENGCYGLAVSHLLLILIFYLTVFEINDLVFSEKDVGNIPIDELLCLHFGDEFLKGGL